MCDALRKLMKNDLEDTKKLENSKVKLWEKSWEKKKSSLK